MIVASDYCLAVSYGKTQPQAFQVPGPLTAHCVRFQLPSVLPFERSDLIAELSRVGPSSCAELEMIACTLLQTRSYLFCDVLCCPFVSSSYPLCCFGRKPVQNSRSTCLRRCCPRFFFTKSQSRQLYRLWALKIGECASVYSCCM